MRSERIALDKIYKRRDRYEIPEWQREGGVWSSSKNSQLIDSILRGWKLPKFYLLKTSEDPDLFEVVDGQQRLAAIWGFFAGEVLLEEAEAVIHSAAIYSELDDAKSDSFDDFEIECDVITEADDDEIRDFFQRLQSGLPLNSSERLNAVSSNLRDFCVRMSKHRFFSEKSTIPPRRYAYFDVCAKVMAVELEGTDTGLRFEELEQVFKQNKSYSDKSASAKRVLQSLDWLADGFLDNRPSLRSRAIVQTLINLTAHLIETGIQKKQVESICKSFELFFRDLTREVELGQQSTRADLMLFQTTINSNKKSGAKIREEILLRHLIRSEPELFNNATASTHLHDGLKTQISADASRVVDLVQRINIAYAAIHGVDLFKATNETASALTKLASPVKDKADYDRFISGLYHVFREGAGTRLASWPDSFRDVNDLRTLEQHDVDHGSGAKAKRKKLSAAFTKYSGVTSSDAASPEQLLLSQANLLDAISDDLVVLETQVPLLGSVSLTSTSD